MHSEWDLLILLISSHSLKTSTFRSMGSCKLSLGERYIPCLHPIDSGKGWLDGWMEGWRPKFKL